MTEQLHNFVKFYEILKFHEKIAPFSDNARSNYEFDKHGAKTSLTNNARGAGRL